MVRNKESESVALPSLKKIQLGVAVMMNILHIYFSSRVVESNFLLIDLPSLESIEVGDSTMMGNNEQIHQDKQTVLELLGKTLDRDFT